MSHLFLCGAIDMYNISSCLVQIKLKWWRAMFKIIFKSSIQVFVRVQLAVINPALYPHIFCLPKIDNPSVRLHFVCAAYLQKESCDQLQTWYVACSKETEEPYRFWVKVTKNRHRNSRRYYAINSKLDVAWP